MKWMKKTEGAISIFLCIILTSMIILSGLLVDGSRIRAGEAQAKRAVRLGAKSTLANYDNMLKELFGIFALAEGNPDALKDELENYINRTLMTELGVDEKSLGEKGYEYIRRIFTGESTFKDVKFLNLYDYNLDSIELAPIYNLSENEVMRSQIVEHMKYRAPKELAEGFVDKLMSFKEFGRQSNIMKKKTGLDKHLNEINKKEMELSALIQSINSFNTGNNVERARLSSYVNHIVNRIDYEKQLYEKRQELAEAETTLTDLQRKVSNASDEKSRKEAEEEYDSYRSNTYDSIVSQCYRIQDNIDKENRLCDEVKESTIKYISDYKKQNEDGTRIISDIKRMAGEAIEKISVIENDLKEDTTDFGARLRNDISSIKKRIDPDYLKKLQETLAYNSQQLKEFNDIMGYVDPRSIKAASQGQVLSNSEVESKIKKSQLVDFCNKYIKNIDYGAPTSQKSGTKPPDPRDGAQKIVDGSSLKKDKIDPGAKNVDSSGKEKLFPRDELPSGAGKVISREFNKEDTEYILSYFRGMQNTFGDGGSSNTSQDFNYDSTVVKSIIDGAKLKDENNESADKAFGLMADIGNIIQFSLEGMRDELYINEYVLCTFKNTITDKFVNETGSKKKPVQLDLRGKPINARKTYFDKSEVEYIIIGAENEKANAYAVQGEILLIRFSLNTLHVYMDPVKNSHALKTAIAVAGWTGFGVPIVHTLIMLAWAMAESVLDVQCLLQGEKVAIFKMKDQWRLDPQNLLTGAAQEALKKTVDEAVDLGVDSVQKLTENAVKKLGDVIETKIGIAIDKAFDPIEKAAAEYRQGVTGSFDDIRTKVNEALKEEKDRLLGEENVDPGSDDMFEIKKAIVDYAGEEVSNMLNTPGIREEFIYGPFDKLQEVIQDKKQVLRDKVYNSVRDYRKNLEGKISQFQSDAGDNAKEKLHDYIDKTLGGRTDKGLSKNGIRDSLLSMAYEDYLRLLLFVTPGDKKIGRLQDLIQLNMREEIKNDKFRLSDYNTYLRVRANVSIKYLFMTQPFMRKELKTSDGARHKFDVLLYEGY